METPGETGEAEEGATFAGEEEAEEVVDEAQKTEVKYSASITKNSGILKQTAGQRRNNQTRKQAWWLKNKRSAIYSWQAAPLNQHHLLCG